MHVTGIHTGVHIVMTLVTIYSTFMYMEMHVHLQRLQVCFCMYIWLAGLFVYNYRAHTETLYMQVLGCAYTTYALSAESLIATLSWLCKCTSVASSKPFHKCAIIGTTDLPHITEVEITSTWQKESAQN